MRFSLIKKIALVTIVLTSCGSFGQQIEETELQETEPATKKSKNPKLATILSAVVPGSGQIYNEKYWKFPLIYAGFTALGYFAIGNNDEYIKYKKAYEDKMDFVRSTADIPIDDPYPGVAAEAIQRERERWRRNRDLTLIGIGILYILNIIDANVDANLFDYDIGEDLAIKICPEIENCGKSPLLPAFPKFIGIGLSYKF